MSESDFQQIPLVGFFPLFVNLAEAGRAVMIAKRYRELGGRIIFFSHGGKYEFLAKNQDFQITRVKPLITEEQMDEAWRMIALDTFRSKVLIKEDWILENVEKEITAFKKTGIRLLVSTNNLTSAISARAAKIPYINILSAPGSFALKIPDSVENIFTHLIPQSCKVRFINWFMPRTKMYLKPINNVAKKVGVSPFKNIAEIYLGDITFATNYLEFVNIFPNQQAFPADDYIGIIPLDELFINKIPKEEAEKIESEIEAHLKRPGRSILVSLGSSGTKDLLINILRALNKTNYNIVAIYTSVLKEKDLPKLSDNILLKKFIPSIDKVNRMVDLAIIHGGQGTVFTAVYAKKPIIGFPMHIEQHINLEKIVGHGCGLMLSKKYFKERTLIDSINKIFSNYDYYLDNCKILANKLPPPQGDKIAAEKILRFVTKM